MFKFIVRYIVVKIFWRVKKVESATNSSSFSWLLIKHWEDRVRLRTLNERGPKLLSEPMNDEEKRWLDDLVGKATKGGGRDEKDGGLLHDKMCFLIY